MHRYELSQAQWDLIKGLVPGPKSTGRPPRDARQLFNGMLWILHTGAPWRDLPRDLYGPWSTVYDHFRAWRMDGTFDRILEQLRIRLDRQGRIDWDVWMIDSTMIRAGRPASGAKKGGPGEPADHALGRSRGGFGTKLHLVSDRHGIPLARLATPGQRGESLYVGTLVDSVRIPQESGPPRRRPRLLIADKGYDHPTVRQALRARHIRALIPRRNDPRLHRRGRPPFFDRELYRGRNAVERLVGNLKERRRLATRFEKFAVSYETLVSLAFMELYLEGAFPYRA
ncbi:MAG: IS5 family transposase [Planctomycetaceae bacterium]|nr:IS5 family transposase [Planctomycetaceae bacterium]